MARTSVGIYSKVLLYFDVDYMLQSSEVDADLALIRLPSIAVCFDRRQLKYINAARHYHDRLDKMHVSRRAAQMKSKPSAFLTATLGLVHITE